MPTNKVAAPKVVAPKKTTSKTSTAAKRPLVYSTEATAFWMNDGQILNSLIALRDALASMPKSVFNHHVSARRNDFALWVEDVLADAACAHELRKAKTPTTAKAVVVKHLGNYRS
jgi:hypothetical protein